MLTKKDIPWLTIRNAETALFMRGPRLRSAGWEKRKEKWGKKEHLNGNRVDKVQLDSLKFWKSVN